MTRLRELIQPVASLRLTVFLLALSMALVFSSTLAQTEQGIWQVKASYFQSFYVWADLHYLRLLLPGGYLVGGALMANLVAAHAVRFRYDRKRFGIICIHAGVALLLIGELATGLLAVESRMEIDEGETVRYSYDIREVELALIDPSPADLDMVTVVEEDRLAASEGETIRDALLPVDVRVDDYMPNAVVRRGRSRGGAEPRSDRGAGVRLTAEERPPASGISDQKVNAPAARVTLLDGERALGTWLVSVVLRGEQRVEVDGKTYLLALRFRRYYKDHSVHLLDFSHDRYTGTDVPRNFSSRVRIEDPDRPRPREHLIYMNNPLHYAGETYYQSAFKNDDRTTILQVVRNPAWTLPYVAVVLSAFGMLLHFGAGLLRFLRRRS